jgi:hypothetical protein
MSEATAGRVLARWRPAGVDPLARTGQLGLFAWVSVSQARK